MEENKEENINKKIIRENNLKEIFASANINFLFGSGVNGRVFPQLAGFIETNKFLNEKIPDTSKSFEEKLNMLSENDESIARAKFVSEFNDSEEKIDWMSEDIEDIKNMLNNIYKLVDKAENRQDSSYKINIFTLNYDDIVEDILSKECYINNVISADSYKKTDFFNVIGYNFEYGKKIPTFVTTKLHGSIKKGKLSKDAIIYPGNKKYETALGPKFFELMFLMKSELIRRNAVLMVIGYSGNDEHINGIISDAIEANLTLIWFRYNNDEKLPEIISKNKEKVIVIDQLEEKIGTTKRCAHLIEEILKV